MSSNEDRELVDTVIKLHDCARVLERILGPSGLSNDIRECAEKLNTLTKPVSSSKKN